MKVLQIIRLRHDDHAKMRAGLENFEKNGAADGLEGLWMSSDGKTIIGFYEVNDSADLSKYNSLYAPYYEQIETHLVNDISVGVANMKAALDIAP
jgi:hypothetical protein